MPPSAGRWLKDRVCKTYVKEGVCDKVKNAEERLEQHLKKANAAKAAEYLKKAKERQSELKKAKAAKATYNFELDHGLRSHIKRINGLNLEPMASENWIEAKNCRNSVENPQFLWKVLCEKKRPDATIAAELRNFAIGSRFNANSEPNLSQRAMSVKNEKFASSVASSARGIASCQREAAAAAAAPPDEFSSDEEGPRFAVIDEEHKKIQARFKRSVAEIREMQAQLRYKKQLLQDTEVQDSRRRLS